MAKPGNPNMKKGAPSVNPKGRPKGRPKKPKESEEVAHYDGYESALTGLGQTGYDKRIATAFVQDTITRNQARDLWQGDDIAARAVDIPVEDAFRQGFTFSVKSKPDSKLDVKELQDAVADAWEDYDVMGKGQRALGYEMAYGGSGVLLGHYGIESTISTPRDKDAKQPFDFLNVFEPEELQAHHYYVDPFGEDYGRVATFSLTPRIAGSGEEGKASDSGIAVHASHFHIFPGIKASVDNEATMAPGWGVGVYTRLWRILRDFNGAWGNVGNIVVDFNQTVLKLKNLAQLLSETGGGNKLKTRLQAMQNGRSILRAIAIDSEESMDVMSTNVSGLSELLKGFMARVSSAAGGIPITKLFGIAPSGLDSSGDSDIAQWDDRVKSIQDKKVIPYLNAVTQAIINAGHIKGLDQVESWSIEANPLRQPTEAEVATTRYTVAQTDVAYINAGVVSPDDIATSRFGGAAYSPETVVDFEAREAFVEAFEKQQQAMELSESDTGDEDEDAPEMEDDDNGDKDKE